MRDSAGLTCRTVLAGSIAVVALMLPCHVAADLDIGILVQQQTARDGTPGNQSRQTQPAPATRPVTVKAPPAQIPQNPTFAARPDAPSEDPDTQFRRAVQLDAGQGSQPDFAKAAKLYRAAAEQGHIQAQANLGLMYAQGHGVKRNDQEAVQWLRKASTAGDPVAQYNLGLMYYEGRGVNRSYAEAMRWYRAAAGRGSTQAMNNIGIMNAMGHGVVESNVGAWAWFALASENGDQDAPGNRDMTAAELTDDQRRAAEQVLQELRQQLAR